MAIAHLVDGLPPRVGRDVRILDEFCSLVHRFSGLYITFPKQDVQTHRLQVGSYIATSLPNYPLEQIENDLSGLLLLRHFTLDE